MNSPRHILVLDDDEAWREGLAEALRGAGHRVDLFDSGPRALEFISTGSHPDAIILDLALDDRMSGAEFAQRVRTGSQHSDIPILAVSGRSTEPIPEASWFLPKPVDFELLLVVLDRFAGGAARPLLATPKPEPAC